MMQVVGYALPLNAHKLKNTGTVYKKTKTKNKTRENTGTIWEGKKLIDYKLETLEQL